MKDTTRIFIQDKLLQQHIPVGYVLNFDFIRAPQYVVQWALVLPIDKKLLLHTDFDIFEDSHREHYHAIRFEVSGSTVSIHANNQDVEMEADKARDYILNLIKVD